MSAPTFLYFAYGSNMNPERIRQRIPGARPLGRATLHGWKVVERLYADIERARGGRVHGVLYCVTPTEIHRLDAYEGFPRIYDSVRVKVKAELMGDENVRYDVPAFTYVMTAETRRERNGRKYPTDYRVICAAGAMHWQLPGNPFGALKPEAKKRAWFRWR